MRVVVFIVDERFDTRLWKVLPIDSVVPGMVIWVRLSDGEDVAFDVVRVDWWEFRPGMLEVEVGPVPLEGSTDDIINEFVASGWKIDAGLTECWKSIAI